MNVKTEIAVRELPQADAASLDTRQRRALVRLGLAANAAYVAPTLLALRTVAEREARARREAAAS